MSVRLEKISSLISDQISLIFLNKLQDPAFGLVTITKVRVSPDLKNAKVYISVYEKEKRNEILNKINDIKAMIRTELAHRIRIKHVPELEFFIDDTLDYVEKMEDLFKQIRQNDHKDPE